MTRSSVEQQAAQWWLRLASDHDLSETEQTALDEWLAGSEVHGQALRQQSEMWFALGHFAGEPEIVSRRADALEAMRRANRSRWARPFHLPKTTYAAAAALLLALTGVGSWYAMQGGTQQLATERGERRALVLADGSRVSLDARTRVSVAIDKAQRRLQMATGRAKFDVAYQPDRPFTVEVDGHVVVATGTSFSTELVGGELHVIVYEGKVAVLKGDMPDPQTLIALRNHPEGRAVAVAPGQEYIARGATALVRKGAPDSSTWEAGRLEFVDTPLSEAVEQLNRYSDDIITITDQRAANIRINGLFKAGNSEAFLDAIARMHPVKVHRSGAKRVDILFAD